MKLAVLSTLFLASLSLGATSIADFRDTDLVDISEADLNKFFNPKTIDGALEIDAIPQASGGGLQARNPLIEILEQREAEAAAAAEANEFDAGQGADAGNLLARSRAFDKRACPAGYHPMECGYCCPNGNNMCCYNKDRSCFPGPKRFRCCKTGGCRRRQSCCNNYSCCPAGSYCIGRRRCRRY